MPTEIGEALRRARVERGMELDDVQRITKIRPRYLLAIEEGRWDRLPDPAYARTFLRSYADAVGLDATDLVARLERELGVERGAPTPSPVSLPTSIRHVPSESVADRGAALAGAEAIRGGLGRRFGPSPGIVAGGATIVVAGVIAVLVLSDGGEEASPGPQPSGRDVRASEPQPSEPREAPRETREEKARPDAPQPRKLAVTITPQRDVWACLVDADERELIEGAILPAGDRQGPFRSRGFTLALGHGSVDVKVNGKPAEVPAAADPIGFELEPDAVRRVPVEDVSDCV